MGTSLQSRDYVGRWRPLRGSYSIDFFSFEQTICPWFQCPLLVEQAAPTIYELSDISVESTIQPSNKERSCFSYPSCCNTWCNTCPNTVVFFSQYGNQVNINSQQRQLVNGVPVSARDACFSSNNENNHPSNKDFYSLLPEALQNVTIGGWGLVTYWSSPLTVLTPFSTKFGMSAIFPPIQPKLFLMSKYSSKLIARCQNPTRSDGLLTCKNRPKVSSCKGLASCHGQPPLSTSQRRRTLRSWLNLGSVNLTG